MSVRAWKVQEFNAHQESVNCLHVGRRSAGVLVTGGEDKKVNLWTIGKAAPQLSLTGHQAPIDCVTFDPVEESVAAGSSSGTLKVWDLNSGGKVAKSFTGHRSNCLCVEYGPHPSHSVLATGSLDTNLKLWDLRTRSCVQTFKGHSRGIRQVRFSPDGSWIATGSEDGVLKVWDLASGRELFELSSKSEDGALRSAHAGSITGLEFNPTEMSLASCSVDRTVKLWDLDMQELIETSPPETTGVRSLLFSKDGGQVMYASETALKVVQWEPLTTCDSVDVAWTKLADLSLPEEFSGNLVGCSFHQTFVGVWVVDLAQVAPFSSNKAAIGAGKQPAKRQTGSEAVLPRFPGRQPQPSARSPTGQSAQPLRSRASPAQSNSAAAAPPSGAAGAADGGATPAPAPQPGIFAALAAARPAMVDAAVGAPGDSLGPGVQPGQLKHLAAKAAADGEGQRAADAAAPSRPARRRGASDAGEKGPRVEVFAPPAPRRPTTPPGGGGGARDRAGLVRQRSGKLQARAPWDAGGDPEPRGVSRGGAAMSSNGRPKSGGSSTAEQEAVLEVLVNEHSGFISLMRGRMAHLKILLELWRKGNVKAVIGELRRSDPADCAQVLSVIASKHDVLLLEHTPELATVLDSLLRAEGQDYQLVTALDCMLMLLKAFGAVIRETCAQDKPNHGVDLSFEQRRERCLAARHALLELRPQLQKLCDGGGDIARRSKNLLDDLSTL